MNQNANPNAHATLQLVWRTRVCPEEARNAGWSKKHQAVEVYIIGKWRMMGYFTPIQIMSNKWQKKAIERICTNSPYAKSFKQIRFINETKILGFQS